MDVTVFLWKYYFIELHIFLVPFTIIAGTVIIAVVIICVFLILIVWKIQVT